VLLGSDLLCWQHLLPAVNLPTTLSALPLIYPLPVRPWWEARKKISLGSEPALEGPRSTVRSVIIQIVSQDGAKEITESGREMHHLSTW